MSKIRNLHIFAISPEKHEGEVDFLPANKHENWYYHFRCVCPGMPKLPKITSLQYPKTEVIDEVDFLYESAWKLVTN